MAYVARTPTDCLAGSGFDVHGRVRNAVQRPGHSDQQCSTRGTLADGQGREEDTLPQEDGDECFQCWRSSRSRLSGSSSSRHGECMQPACQHSRLFTTTVGIVSWISTTCEPGKSRQRPSSSIQ
eukprot:7960298-Pyramimonas_sp.AAC.1